MKNPVLLAAVLALVPTLFVAIAFYFEGLWYVGNPRMLKRIWRNFLLFTTLSYLSVFTLFWFVVR